MLKHPLKPFPFSDRLKSIETQTNPLTLKKEKLIRKGITILDLTISNPTQSSFKYLDQNLLEAFQNHANLTYEPDPLGLLKARQEIINYYANKGVPLKPDQIILTANTSEAYTFIFKLLMNSGDELLAPAPSYPLLDDLAHFNDVAIKRYELQAQNDWRIDLDNMNALATNRTRGMLFIHPNNPTGNYFHSSERQNLADWLTQKNLALIVDEVFLDFGLEPSYRKNTFADFKDVLTFTLSGISKVLGLPQMKLSWIVVNGPEPLLMNALDKLSIISDTYLSVSTPAQNAFHDWMKCVDTIQDEIRFRVSQNYARLVKEISGAKITVHTWQGGWVIPIRLPDTLDDEGWALALLESGQVLTHPGYFYNFADGVYLVVSLLVPEKIFAEGLVRIIKIVNAVSCTSQAYNA